MKIGKPIYYFVCLQCGDHLWSATSELNAPIPQEIVVSCLNGKCSMNGIAVYVPVETVEVELASKEDSDKHFDKYKQIRQSYATTN